MSNIKLDDWVDKYIFDNLSRWPMVTLVVVVLLYVIAFVNRWIP